MINILRTIERRLDRSAINQLREEVVRLSAQLEEAQSMGRICEDSAFYWEEQCRRLEAAADQPFGMYVNGDLVPLPRANAVRPESDSRGLVFSPTEILRAINQDRLPIPSQTVVGSVFESGTHWGWRMDIDGREFHSSVGYFSFAEADMFLIDALGFARNNGYFTKVAHAPESSVRNLS